MSHRVPAGVELVYTRKRWQVDDLTTNRRFVLDPTTLLVLVAVAAGEQTARDVARRLSTVLPITEDKVAQRLDVLVARDILSDGEETTQSCPSWPQTLRDTWRQRHWEVAARYYLASYDYPFLDYSAAKGGFAIDRKRMAAFRQVEPDLNRVKEYPGSLTVALPRPVAALVPGVAHLDGPAPSVPRQPDAVARALSMTFASIGEIPYDVQPAAPAIRRTSPSGGARHPSEAYLFNVGLEEFDPGIYHLRSTTPALERIADLPGESELARMFQATWTRSPFSVLGIVVVTCVFERNMYRYREPRTFRTIHMDAGHLATTLELTARHLGLRTFTQYRDCEPEVEAALGLHFLEEGYLLSVALG